MKRATTLAVLFRRLSWSISSHFVAVQPLKSAPQPKIAKNTKTPYFKGSRSLNVIDVNTAEKLVNSDSHATQHSCLSSCFHARHANI